MAKSNEAKVWDTLYGNDVDKRVRYKFQVGDRVRISKVKRMFEKSYLPNFTEQILTIYKQFARQVPVYNWKIMLERSYTEHSRSGIAESNQGGWCLSGWKSFVGVNENAKE